MTSWRWVLLVSLVLVVLVTAILVVSSVEAFDIGRVASLGQGGTTIITRTLPSASLPNATIPVTLQIALGPKSECSPPDAACNDYLIVDERLPVGSQGVLTSTEPDCVWVTPARLSCVYVSQVTSHTLTYQATLPAAYGDVFFSGTVMVQGDTTPATIAGPTRVSLPIPTSTPTCTSAWACDAYGPWSNATESCGNRSRTCTDTANCTAPTNQPTVNETAACHDLTPIIVVGRSWIDTLGGPLVVLLAAALLSVGLILAVKHK